MYVCMSSGALRTMLPSLGHCPTPAHPPPPALPSLNPTHLVILSLDVLFRGASGLPHSDVTLEGEVSGKTQEGF